MSEISEEIRPELHLKSLPDLSFVTLGLGLKGWSFVLLTDPYVSTAKQQQKKMVYFSKLFPICSLKNLNLSPV